VAELVNNQAEDYPGREVQFIEPPISGHHSLLPRVEFFVKLLKCFSIQMSVNLRSRYICVTEKFLDGSYVRARLNEES
jgi:hypothetical protein